MLAVVGFLVGQDLQGFMTLKCSQLNWKYSHEATSSHEVRLFLGGVSEMHGSRRLISHGVRRFFKRWLGLAWAS